MPKDLSGLMIQASKPRGKPASLLSEMGISIIPIEADEGNVDRYIISKRLAIDRRTGSSFLNGIMDKTLFTSAIYLREHFQIPVLIIEGEVNYEYTMFDRRAIRGALSSMMLQYGLNVLSTPNLDETVALVAMMSRQEQIGIPEISLIPKRKATDLADMQRRIIEMLPGSGRVMARELLQSFGSVKRIVNATEKSLKGIRGLGAKKAAEICRVLNADYEAVDTEKNLEDAIEVEPSLLFKDEVELLARQQYVYTEENERQFIDMVFADLKKQEIILVELKRGKLTRENLNQLCRYMDHAYESKLISTYLEKGLKLRGILATVEKCSLNIRRKDVSFRIVDKKQTIDVLKKMRKR